MSSYLGTLNSLLSTTTDRYNSLRRNILSSSSEDDTNVDDPDCTHVSRVLRSYYIEKGRQLPSWLPPDPRQAQRAQAGGSSTGAFSAVRPLGSLRSRTIDHQASGRDGYGQSGMSDGRSSGGIGDIWGDRGSMGTNNAAGPGTHDLRKGAMISSAMGPSPSSTSVNLAPGGGSDRRRGMVPRSLTSTNELGGATSGGYADTANDNRLNVRPLPSQRAGSYQTPGQTSGQTSSPFDARGRSTGYPADQAHGGLPSSVAPGATSGRDRLRAKMGSQRVASQSPAGWQGRG